jgi:hypothetical protein
MISIKAVTSCDKACQHLLLNATFEAVTVEGRSKKKAESSLTLPAVILIYSFDSPSYQSNKAKTGQKHDNDLFLPESFPF